MGLTNLFQSQAYGAYETKLESEILKGGPLPTHVAIIMDGNRRYAKEILRADDPKEGHVKGKDKLEEVMDWCFDLGIRNLTVYAFSTENFSRPDDEVDFLLELIKDTLVELSDDKGIHEKRVRLRVIGEKDMLDGNFLRAADEAMARTSGYSDFNFNIAIAYGGRQEIVTAVKKIATDVREGRLDVSEIDEALLSSNMYMGDIPDPDLVLRTSGELRLSNFLIWQLAYAELYFTDVYWPGFRYVDFLRAIRSFQQRNRRYGR
ncbi:MAG: di-trans,poly-cis-decaprenylcistransferase [Thermoplasmatales archaeon]|nr:di-trans,poly-cis-decaprenylcistransferase [Thermoplasmatales archaeon]